MKRGLLIGILAILLFACSPVQTPEPTPTLAPTPTLSDLFKTQALKLVEEASTLMSMTDQGVSFVDFSGQLSEVRGVYEILNSLWEEDFQIETKENIESALNSWSCALKLWNLKIDYKYALVETGSGKEYFQEIYSCGGDDLILDTYFTETMIDEKTGEERDVREIPYENIGVLFSAGNDYFKKAQPLILRLIQ